MVTQYATSSASVIPSVMASNMALPHSVVVNIKGNSFRRRGKMPDQEKEDGEKGEI